MEKCDVRVTENANRAKKKSILKYIFGHCSANHEIHTVICPVEIGLLRRTEWYHRWEKVPKYFIKIKINVMTTTKTTQFVVQNRAIEHFYYLHFQRSSFLFSAKFIEKTTNLFSFCFYHNLDRQLQSKDTFFSSSKIGIDNVFMKRQWLFVMTVNFISFPIR